MSSQPTNLVQEEIKLLLRATRSTSRFRFIIVQYNHYDLVRRVQTELNNKYPNKIIQSIDLENELTADFPNQVSNCDCQLLLLENFDELLKKENSSIAVGFNQRRDKYSAQPFMIIAFVSFGDKSLRDFASTLPDVFSITNPIIQLKQEFEAVTAGGTSFTTFVDSPFNNIREAKAEIARIKKRLEELDDIEENARLIFILKNELGKAYRFIGEYEKAKSTFEEILINENLFDDDRVTIQANLVSILEHLELYEEGLELMEKALLTDLANYESNSSRIAERLNEKAMILKSLKRYDEAIELLEKALEIDILHFNENHQRIIIHKTSLATVFIDKKEYRKAKDLIESLLEKNFLGENLYEELTVYSILGIAFYNLKNYQSAKLFLSKTLKSSQESLGQNHPETATAQFNLATLYFQINKRKEAKKLIQKAYKTNLRKLGQNHSKTKRTKEWAKHHKINL